MALVAVLLVAGCKYPPGPVLELALINESSDAVTVDVVVGTDPNGEAELHEVVESGEQRDVGSMRGWTEWRVLVDGTAVTTSGEWPDDNPTIDLTIHVAPDGSVEVIDE